MPRRLPSNHPRGDYRAQCAYCGMTWYRSDLFRDADGFLRCPDDADGESNIELLRGNAEAAAEILPRLPGEEWP